MASLPFSANRDTGTEADAAPSPIPVRSLGHSGVALPVLGLGCAGLGELFVRLPEEAADALLDTAWDAAGIRYYDTSPWYGRGLSEHRVGRLLRRRPRRAAILSTKVGRVFHRRADTTRPIADQWSGGLNFEHRFDYTHDGIMRSFEDSLLRLGDDRLDLLVIHDLDAWHHGDADGIGQRFHELATSGWKALERLRSGGAVAAVGAGINLHGLTGRFLDQMPLDFFLVALRFTLLEHCEFLETEMPRLVRQGIGVVAGAPFSSGLGVTGPVAGARFNYAPADAVALAHAGRIEAICRDHGVPLAAAALAFPLRHPSVASVIPGAVSAAEVAEIDRWRSTPVPSSLWSDLATAGLIARFP